MPEKMQKQKLSEPSGKPEAGQASIRVLAQSEDFAEAAERLAARLGIDCAAGGNNPDNAADPGDFPVLLIGERGLSLCAGDAGLRADFAGMIPRLTQRNLAQELLVQSVYRGASLGRASKSFGGLPPCAGCRADGADLR